MPAVTAAAQPFTIYDQPDGSSLYEVATGAVGTDGFEVVYKNCDFKHGASAACLPLLRGADSDNGNDYDELVVSPPVPDTPAICTAVVYDNELAIDDNVEPSSSGIYSNISLPLVDPPLAEHGQYENCGSPAGEGSVLDQTVSSALASWELRCHAQGIPTGTVAHQSQLDCEEPSYEKVPAWRREQLEAAVDEKVASLSPRQLRRFRAREAAQRARADRALELVTAATSSSDIADRAQGARAEQPVAQPGADLVAKWLRSASKTTAPGLNRLRAAELLRESGLGEGAFCFRKSKSEGMVVLCVLSANGKVANIRLEPRPDARVIEVHDLVTPLRLPTMGAVLEHFSDLANQPNNSVPLTVCLPETAIPGSDAVEATVASG